jgi:hypothetical protein
MTKIFLSVAAVTLGLSTFVAAQTTPSITEMLKGASF